MTALLELGPTDRVLEIGTGSGYQAALLSRLAAEVVTIERLPEVADRARKNLAALGIKNVEVICRGRDTRLSGTGSLPGNNYHRVFTGGPGPPYRPARGWTEDLLPPWDRGTSRSSRNSSDMAESWNVPRMGAWHLSRSSGRTGGRSEHSAGYIRPDPPSLRRNRGIPRGPDSGVHHERSRPVRRDRSLHEHPQRHTYRCPCPLSSG